MPPIADLDFARDIVASAFGVDGHLTRLHGEYDDNFRLDSADGARYLLKIAHPDELPSTLEFQNDVLARLAMTAPDLPVQRVVDARDGARVARIVDGDGRVRLARLLTFLPGRLLAHTRPHTPQLLESMGVLLGRTDAALSGFTHSLASRALKWDLARAEWIAAHTAYIADGKRRDLVERHLSYYLSRVQPALAGLRSGVAHNDANDHNVLVEGTGYAARASGLLDWGDAVRTPTVCNLAIALAYAMLDKPDPLASVAHVVAGYHAAHPLDERELELLFELARMRLVVSVTNSAFRKTESPDDPYVTISEGPAWATLERIELVHPRFAQYAVRSACGLEPVPGAPRVVEWLARRAGTFARLVRTDLSASPVEVLDLSVGSLDIGLLEDVDTTGKFTRDVFSRIDAAGAAAGIGRYDEPRLIYANDDFATLGEDGVEFRTIHIGLDVFLPAGEPVFSPLDGVIHSLRDNAARLDYGPCVIVEHDAGGMPFWTLYGHLSRASLEGLRPGMRIAAGRPLGAIGAYPENGDWPPHLHFQVITDLLGFDGTFPGVARPSDRAVWRSLCPDPNIICGIPGGRFPAAVMRGEVILAERRERIGRNLSVSYRNPLTIVRGRGQYLYDDDGRRFLDGYNNVPHVGHSHPRVVRAAQRQMAVLNTNTRYLHENLVAYARRLADTLPAPLRVCYFVCSGSEATELAIRLARAHTGHRDVIVSDGAYHGHTSTLIDISPYKAEGPGGHGLPDWVHKAPLPDVYRGPHKKQDPDAGRKYAVALAPIIDSIRARGRGLAGFLIESVPSVGGQIVLPDGYLAEAYRHVRAAGGVCMADEVQTGFGRIGTHMWAFEAQGVVPDVVAIGKPIGNGYPMGAVVTTPEIAASFDNGMEFFATFGGTAVSCAVGIAVLDVVEQEGLQRHALEIGDHLLARLRALQDRHALVGDVRGSGLMLGVELVRDRATLEPAPGQASYIVNRLRDRGVLIGTDGIFHNVLKIRGPMVLTRDDADTLIANLDAVLGEDAAQPNPAV